jgi:PIN domain nuclease of toxin-antitoxin system
MSLVFDSSAMFAFLFDETGADAVEELLDDADVPKYAHAVNLCEVFYRVTLKQNSTTAAQEAMTTLREAGIVERNDMDAALWQDVAKLVAAQRGSGHGLALGDAFCVALARRLSADVVTSDHAEFDPIASLGLASVTFIR